MGGYNPDLPIFGPGGAPLIDVPSTSYFCCNGQPLGVSSGNAAIPFGANFVQYFSFILPYSTNIRRILAYVSGAIAGAHFSTGIYSADGQTLLVDMGPQDYSVGGAHKVTLANAVFLAAGLYRWAWTADNISASGLIAYNTINQSSSTVVITDPATSAMFIAGFGSIDSVGGQMPSSLGTLNGHSSGGPQGVQPLFIFAS